MENYGNDENQGAWTPTDYELHRARGATKTKTQVHGLSQDSAGHPLWLHTTVVESKSRIYEEIEPRRVMRRRLLGWWTHLSVPGPVSCVSYRSIQNYHPGRKFYIVHSQTCFTCKLHVEFTSVFFSKVFLHVGLLHGVLQGRLAHTSTTLNPLTIEYAPKCSTCKWHAKTIFVGVVIGTARGKGQIGKIPQKSGEIPMNRESPQKVKKGQTGTDESKWGSPRLKSLSGGP